MAKNRIKGCGLVMKLVNWANSLEIIVGWVKNRIFTMTMALSK